MFHNHNSSEVGATVDDIMLPPIEDEAWKELEKEVGRCGPMEATENNPPKLELSQTASPSSTKNCTDTAWSTNCDRSTEGIGCFRSAYQQSAVAVTSRQVITTVL